MKSLLLKNKLCILDFTLVENVLKEQDETCSTNIKKIELFLKLVVELCMLQMLFLVWKMQFTDFLKSIEPTKPTRESPQKNFKKGKKVHVTLFLN